MSSSTRSFIAWVNQNVDLMTSQFVTFMTQFSAGNIIFTPTIPTIPTNAEPQNTPANMIKRKRIPSPHCTFYKSVTVDFTSELNHSRTSPETQSKFNANGSHIQHEAFACTNHGKTLSTEGWPETPPPTQSSIKSWQAFLQTFCITDSLKLRKPLGTWTDHISPQRWIAYYNANDLTAFLQLPNTWNKHQRGQHT